MTIRAVVVVPTDQPSQGLALHPIMGVPLVMWGVAALRRQLRADEIGVLTRNDQILALASRAGVHTLDSAPSPDIPQLDALMPFHSEQSLAALLDRRSVVRSPTESIRVTDDGTCELADRVARGLPIGHELTRGVLRMRLPLAVDVRAIVSDVDGCLTDGLLFRQSDGGASRGFNTKDGIGHHMLEEAGVRVGWLSTANEAESIRVRAESLGVRAIDVGIGSKGPRFENLCSRLGVEPRGVVYLGDDTNDLPAMELAGLSACPADAHPDVRASVDLVLERPGGRGCFRELADIVTAGRAFFA